MTNLLFLGNYSHIVTDWSEGNYQSENAGAIVGVTSDSNQLKVVGFGKYDANGDGVISDDDFNTADSIQYNTGSGTISTKTDSTMLGNVKVTLSDGSTQTIQVVIIQQTNGDLFITDYHNNGSLDNLSIAKVEIVQITNNCLSGWYANQSVDNTVIAPVISKDGYVDGTSGNDRIDAAYTGDPQGDRVDANDQILPGEGSQDDVILAGAGNDFVLAGTGNDEVYGGTGDDTLCGQDGDDTLYGGKGNDTLEGMNGNDLVFGQDGSDAVFGDAGNDVLVGGTGNDSMTGGTGNDFVAGGIGTDKIDAGTGDDVVYGGAGADSIEGGAGNDTLYGGGIDDAGKITFNDLTKGTLVDGQYVGQGVHIYSADPHTPVMIFDTATPTGGDTDLATSNLGKVLILSEDRDSTDPDDNAGGGTFVMEFDSPAYVESLDFLDIEGGAWIKMYDANGTLIRQIDTATTANNGQLHQIINQGGVVRMEVVIANSGAIDNLCYSLDPNAGDLSDVINGGDGLDAIYGGAGGDVIHGGNDADYVDGGADNDVLYGDAGNDRLVGGTGDDSMYGGDGNDVFDDVAGTSNDGFGNDYADGGAGDDVIYTGVGNDTLVGGTGNDRLFGEDGNDSLNGGAGNDVIFGGAGNDVAGGVDGNDEIWMGSGNDTATGGAGNDWIHGEDGNDSLNGGAGNDMVFGEAGNDEISGGAGDDYIEGGTGNDVLCGDDADGANGRVDELTLHWNQVAAAGTGLGATQTYGVGGMNVTVGFTAQDAGAIGQIQNTQMYVEAGENFSANSGLYLYGLGGEGGVDNTSTTTLTFASNNAAYGNEVQNVSFRINDIDNGTYADNHIDIVTVRAYDAAGNLIPVTIQAESGSQIINGNTVTGGVEHSDGVTPASQLGSVLYTIQGPVARIEIDYDNGEMTDQRVDVTDINFFTTASAPINAEAGNDVIFGGAGDDVIYGKAGDDQLTGGAGVDTIYGGADRDTIFGAAGDIVDGGAAGNDFDVLDVTGQGSYILTGPGGVGAPIPDSNGNGIDGRLVFVDADGNPTGQFIDFTEIEQIIGDEANMDPDATDDAFDAGEDTPTSVIGNVITGDTGNGADSDPNGDTLTVSEVNGDAAGVGQPVAGDNGGLITINPDGTISFDPNGEFEALGDGETATTTITYTVDDGNGGTDTATVTITVTGTNDGPTAVADVADANQNDLLDLGNVVTANDTDPEGDSLTVVNVNGDPAGVGQPVAGDNGGLITINADGTASFDPNGDFDGLADGETTTTEVTYTITDPDGETSTTTVTITVTGTNDGPTAVADVADASEDGITVLDNVLGNDTDPDSDPLTVAEVNGDAANVGQPVAGDNGGLVTINADGSASFDPNGEFDGLADGETATTEVAYTITDPDGETSTTTVTITVTGVNDGPVAVDNGYVVSLTEAAGDIDGNVITDNTGAGTDSDPENDTLTVVAVNGAAGNVGTAVVGNNGGLFTINPDGTVDFDANGDFDDLGLGVSETTSVTYTISDGNGGFDTATATFTVTGINDGTVEGTAGDDLIDVAYTGDPNGDFVDNNDAILPGDTGNDDLIYGYGGNDTVNAGAGNDEVYGGTGNDQLNGQGGDDTLYGDAGNDTLNGNQGNDTLFGGTGDDLANGGLGNDVVFGGDGNDIVNGQSGNDTIDGGAGDDMVNGGEGDDVLSGGTGNDKIEGSEGNDTLRGNDGDDDLWGGIGNDTVFGGSGNDTVAGGEGEDNLSGGNGDDLILGEAGNDTIGGGTGDDSIDGGTGNDSILAGTGNDVVEGGDGNDVINAGNHDDPYFDNPYPGLGLITDPNPNNDLDTVYGGAGDDIILTGDDRDTIYGGTGNDIIDAGIDNDIVFGDAGNDIIVGGEGVDIVEGGDGDDLIYGGLDNDTLDIIDALDALPLNNTDTLYGGAGNDTIFGRDDADTLFGGTGNDVLDGGIDDDVIYGDEGNDTIIGGQGNDTVFGGAGEDTIFGGDGNDVIAGNLDNDTIYGGAGEDTITGSLDDDLIFGGADNDEIRGGDGDDTISGDEGDDYIQGGYGDDTLYGGAGNDSLNSGFGNDVMFGGDGDDNIAGYDQDDVIYGGEGNDTLAGGRGDDTIFGDAGEDTIFGGDGNDVIAGNLDNDTIYGGAGEDTITGSLDDDLIFGGADNDEIRGGDGDDTISGDEGDDYIQGGYGDDTLYGGAGNDSLNSGFGNDVIYGGEGDDNIAGYDQNDVLFGGEGNDTLTGGDGNDVISGGAGVDDQFGGFGSDTFLGGNGGDNVVGGEDPDNSDIDVLDLTGSGVDRIVYTVLPDGTTDPESGTVFFLDGSTMTFAEIENVIPCFTPGTTIATPKGERLVEELRVGDRIITRDNGIQEIAWVGHKEMSGKQLVQNPHLRPIMIKAGSLGHGLPERDMMVSPNHRVLVASELTQLYFEESEVLAAAKHMVGAKGIHAIDVMSTTYVHFMFERHEVVLSNGAWTESFQPGDYSLKGIGNSQRNEIMELFPELATKTGLEGYQSARKALKKHEAKLLLK